MRDLHALAVIVREIATELLIDQLETGDAVNVAKNAELVRCCNLVTSSNIAVPTEAIDYIYSIAKAWDLA